MCTHVAHLIKISLDVCHVLYEFIYWESKNEHTFVKNRKEMSLSLVGIPRSLNCIGLGRLQLKPKMAIIK